MTQYIPFISETEKKNFVGESLRLGSSYFDVHHPYTYSL